MVETQEFRAILRMLGAHGTLDIRENEEAIAAKIAKVGKFMTYSIAQGTLDIFTPYSDLTDKNSPSSKLRDSPN